MPRRRALVLACLAGLTIAAFLLAPAATGSTSARYTVTATDFRFRIAPQPVRAGRDTFTVVNRGQATHDFKIAGRKTRILNPGARTTLTVTLKKGRYVYLCTVPGHAALGMKGTLIVR
jgi:plastocyanin